MKSRITQDDFEHTLRGRIFAKDRLDLFTQSESREPPGIIRVVGDWNYHANSIMTRYPKIVRWQISLPILTLLTSFGCGSSAEVAKPPAAKGELELLSKPIPTNGKVHPLAKNLELGGFRITEPKPGTLRVKFNVVNHSQADLVIST